MRRTTISTTEVDPRTGAGIPGTVGAVLIETVECTTTGCPGVYGWSVDESMQRRRIASGHDHFVW